MLQNQAFVVCLDFGLRIAAKNLEHRGTEDGFKIIHPAVVNPELPLESRPRDGLRFPVRDAVQALSQPGVDGNADKGTFNC